MIQIRRNLNVKYYARDRILKAEASNLAIIKKVANSGQRTEKLGPW